MEIWFKTPNKSIRRVCLQAVHELCSIPIKVHNTVSSRFVISCNGIVCRKYQTLTRQQHRRKRHLEQELKRNLEEKITVFTRMQDKSLTMIPHKNTSAKENCTYLNPSTSKTSAQKNILLLISLRHKNTSDSNYLNQSASHSPPSLCIGCPYSQCFNLPHIHSYHSQTLKSHCRTNHHQTQPLHWIHTTIFLNL
jgi:hypothetical protein